MAKATLSPLQRQLARVHRRLLVQSLLNCLICYWVGVILLSAGWFFVQPLLLDQPPEWLRWVVAGGLLGLGTVAAVLHGSLRAPSKLAAALSLDAEFGLKERVTTSLMLAPEQEASPAGQALLEDVNQRVDGLDVGSRFPLRMSWWAALLPVCAALLAMVALFYEPTTSHAKGNVKEDAKQPPPNASEIDQKMKELAKRPPAEKTDKSRLKSEDLEKLEAELEKLANRPHGTKEEIRERVKEMTQLEEQMKTREKEMADKARALRDKMQKLDSLATKDSEGPAKELEKALAEGKMDKAKDEVERLRQRVQKNELTQKEKEQLQKQLEKLKKKLDDLAQQKQKQDELKKANLDPETLQREMNELKKESQKLGDLKELSEKLGKCEKALKEGDMQSASESLKQAADKMKNMQGDEQDLQDLRDQLRSLQDAKDSCCQGMGEKEEGDPQESDLDEDRENNGGVGAGKRPMGKKKPFKSFESRSRAEFDAKGKKIFDGYAPGQSFRKKTGAEIAGDIKQASQEAPEAIEQQRIPKAAREMAKGYFQKMREQAEKDQKEAPKP